MPANVPHSAFLFQINSIQMWHTHVVIPILSLSLPLPSSSTSLYLSLSLLFDFNWIRKQIRNSFFSWIHSDNLHDDPLVQEMTMTFRTIRLDFVFDFDFEFLGKLGTHYSHMEYIEQYRISFYEMSFFILCQFVRQLNHTQASPTKQRMVVNFVSGLGCNWMDQYTYTLCTWHLTWLDALTLPDLQQTDREREFSIVQEIWLPHAQDRAKYTLRNDVLW